MDLKPIDAFCTKCRTKFTYLMKPKKSFLGFQKLYCPTCKSKVLYPLTKGFRITYQIFFVWMLIAIAFTFSQGFIGLPSWIAVLVMIALFKDRSMRKRLAKINNKQCFNIGTNLNKEKNN